jgi:hypothetical protein
MSEPPAQDDAADEALARLGALAPQWYREGRHAELVAACAALEAQHLRRDWPEGLALWRALATWYVDPAAALAQFRELAERRGLVPASAPAALPQRGDDLFLLAALFRSELATLAPPTRLHELAEAIARHLAAPGGDAMPVLQRLGGVTASLAALSLEGGDAARVAELSSESLALVARLEDRHSLCSAVALARWPLLRGEPALARETCELIAVGLLAGDDAHMPLAHGWLMSVQDEIAQGERFDLLRAWQDGSMDRAALIASPIAPVLLGALAMLDAQAPATQATDVHAVLLTQQERFSPFDRWMARAARCWSHLRDGDVPAARAMLRLLAQAPWPRGSLLGQVLAVLEAQCRWMAGEDVAPLVAAPAAMEAAWPGPRLAQSLLVWACGHAVPQEAALAACDRLHAGTGLVLPLFVAPALAAAALARLDEALPEAAAASPWSKAAHRRVAAAGTGADEAVRAAPAAVRIRLLDGLHIEAQGHALPLGRKPPRRLLELVALLALRWPAEVPPTRLADALYPELEGDAARRALDTALYRLRRLLPPGSLRRGPVGVALDAAAVTVDRRGPGARWLPEFDQPWAEAARRSAAD